MFMLISQKLMKNRKMTKVETMETHRTIKYTLIEYQMKNDRSENSNICFAEKFKGFEYVSSCVF